MQLTAKDPEKLVLPLKQDYFEWSFANSAPLQASLHSFMGQITYHLPSHKLLQLAKSASLSLRPKNSLVPLQGPTVFTDRSGRTGKAIVTWKDDSRWQMLEVHESDSAQLVELKAATMAFQPFPHAPLNLVTDSAYIADVEQRIDCLLLKEVNNATLFSLLKSLWSAIQDQMHPYYILHI